MVIMKRSKNIRLVLVTTVLAACNRSILPDRPEAGYIPDSSLTAKPAYNDTRYDCDCTPDSTDNAYPDNYFTFSYTGLPYGYAHSHGYVHRKHISRHNHAFVIRGGFGKSAISRASAAAS